MESFRNFVKGWMGRTFLILVLVVFVVFAFAPQFSPPGSQGEVAEVNGERIQSAELDQAVEAVMARFQGQVDRRTLEQMISRDAVLESLIRRRVLVDSASGLGLVAHPALVQDSIRAIEGFQDESGQFSEAIFQQVIMQNGFANAAAFRQRVADELLSSQLTGGLRDSAFATRAELDMLNRIGEQKRDIAWVRLAPASFAAGVTLTDAEMQARYDGNPSGYMTPEQFAIDYVELDLDSYAAEEKPAADAVKARYDDMVSRAQQNAERRVAHVLVSTAGRSEADARKRAEEALAKIAAGETFARVAATYSDDAGSKEAGGDLGFVGRGVLEAPLDAALFQLRAGDVSGPVKAADGIHLLKFLEAREVEVPAFADARAGIEAGLAREQARARFDELVDKLGALAYEADNLAEPAKELGLQVRSSGLFGRQGGPGIAAERKVVEEVMTPEVLEDGRNSGVIKISDTRSVVLRLKEHQKPRRLPFGEVAGQIRTELLHEKSVAAATAKAQALRDAVLAGRPLDDVATEAGAAVTRVEGARRGAQDVPREVLQAAFAAGRPADGRVVAKAIGLADGSQAVVTVSAVVDGNLLGLAPEEVSTLRGQLAGEVGRSEFTQYVEQATLLADVVRVRDGGEGGVLDALKDLQGKAQQAGP